MKIIRAATTVGAFGLWFAFALPLSAADPTPTSTEETEVTRLREVREVERLNAMYRVHRDREYRAHWDQIQNPLPAVSVKPPNSVPAKSALSSLFD